MFRNEVPEIGASFALSGEGQVEGPNGTPKITSPEPPVILTPAPTSRISQYVEIIVALGFVVLGAIVLFQTRDIRVPKAMARVGPRVIPTIIGYGLIVIGVWYAITVLRGGEATADEDTEDADPNLPTDWVTLAGISITLIVYAAIIEPVGFVFASAVLFLGAAFSMGSRTYIRDVIVAAILSVATFLLFTHALNVRLPEGVLDGLL